MRRITHVIDETRSEGRIRCAACSCMTRGRLRRAASRRPAGSASDSPQRPATGNVRKRWLRRRSLAGRGSPNPYPAALAAQVHLWLALVGRDHRQAALEVAKSAFAGTVISPAGDQGPARRRLERSAQLPQDEDLDAAHSARRSSPVARTSGSTVGAGGRFPGPAGGLRPDVCAGRSRGAPTPPVCRAKAPARRRRPPGRPRRPSTAGPHAARSPPSATYPTKRRHGLRCGRGSAENERTRLRRLDGELGYGLPVGRRFRRDAAHRLQDVGLQPRRTGSATVHPRTRGRCPTIRCRGVEARRGRLTTGAGTSRLTWTTSRSRTDREPIAVKLGYGLSVDPAERDARLLAGGGAKLSCRGHHVANRGHQHRGERQR